MSIGQAYTHVLSPNERKALEMACDILIDHAFDDLKDIEGPEDVANSWFEMHLPARYLPKYTPLFLKKFTVCLITVTWKLAQPEHLPPASLAEELAAWALVQEAQTLLQDTIEGSTDADDLNSFVDSYFEDLDFQFLFENAYDGIEETEVGRDLGIAPLNFDNWFKPFSRPDQAIHPYVAED